ncbi:hypothetical protein BN2476_500206 [Paraburkholderia piptadeniae]|uniref:Uncharacterized protein n=1 Tax=Paraburkholderia piptadeniae TaxID=1701573 RepID=A0A1N7SGE9_9BURK|nr:hypothetical protein BN2476_500206 [Paraburkholderia piptadeniae]
MTARGICPGASQHQYAIQRNAQFWEYMHDDATFEVVQERALNVLKLRVVLTRLRVNAFRRV